MTENFTKRGGGRPSHTLIQHHRVMLFVPLVIRKQTKMKR